MKTWVEVEYCPPNGSEPPNSFVARIDDDLEVSIFNQPEDAFIRFEFVRWLDEDESPVPNEDDGGFGTDHYFFLRKSTIFRVSPLRGEHLARWDNTLPGYAE